MIDRINKLDMLDDHAVQLTTGQTVTTDSAIAAPELLDDLNQFNGIGTGGRLNYFGKVFVHESGH